MEDLYVLIMFAVIETGGKQYIVREGSIIKVEKLNIEKGNEVEFDNVISLANYHSNNVKVKAEVLEHKRGDKVVIFKKKRRKNYRRKTGHRQHITTLRINNITSED